MSRRESRKACSPGRKIQTTAACSPMSTAIPMASQIRKRQPARKPVSDMKTRRMARGADQDVLRQAYSF